MSRSFLKRSTLCRGFNSLCFIASARYQMDNRTGNSPHQSWSASISVLIKQVSIRHRPMFSTGACYRGGPEIDTYDNQPVLVCITTTFSQSRPNISLFNQVFVVTLPQSACATMTAAIRRKTGPSEAKPKRVIKGVGAHWARVYGVSLIKMYYDTNPDNLQRPWPRGSSPIARTTFKWTEAQAAFRCPGG
jgi:hypothetical protein